MTICRYGIPLVPQSSDEQSTAPEAHNLVQRSELSAAQEERDEALRSAEMLQELVAALSEVAQRRAALRQAKTRERLLRKELKQRGVDV